MLAVELSTAEGSLALFEGAAPVAARTWREERRAQRSVFRALRAALEEAGWTPDAVDRFAVGRGPGVYSGLRVAMTLARGLALPAGRDVYAVASGAALAAELAAEGRGGPVAIVGDARRGHLWLGLFEPAPGAGVRQAGDWQLVAPAALAGRLPAGATAATSEWARVGPHAAAHPAPGVRWIEGDRFPRAEWVGRLALERRAAGEPSEPLAPLYLHPAVG